MYAFKCAFLFFDCHHLLLAHLLGISILSDIPNATNAAFSIGLKNESKEFTEKIIKLLAVMWIQFTVCARTEVVLHAANSYFTPLCFFILATTWTFTIQILTTSATIQTAISNQIFINFNFCFHKYSLFCFSNYWNVNFSL